MLKLLFRSFRFVLLKQIHFSNKRQLMNILFISPSSSSASLLLLLLKPQRSYGLNYDVQHILSPHLLER